MKKLLAFLLSAMLVLSASGTFVFAESDTSWSYDNSVLVTVTAKEDRTFTPADFSEVNCKDVIVTEKIKAEDSYTYEVVLIINPEKQAMDFSFLKNELGKRSDVKNVERNKYVNDYDERQSVMALNKTEINIPVGCQETLYITDLTLGCFKANNAIYYVLFELDPEMINEEALTKDSFAEYGIFHFWAVPDKDQHERYFTSVVNSVNSTETEGKKSDNHWYYGLVTEDISTRLRAVEDRVYAEAVNNIYDITGVLSAYLYWTDTPAYSVATEKWDVEDSSVVSAVLSGGAEQYPNQYIDCTATITGLKEGTTIITVFRNQSGGEAKTECRINVYMRGDVNGDGELNNIDAALILKHDASLVELPEDKLSECDMNNDGDVNNIDAALILKYDAGL